MMETVFRVKTSELNEEFLKAVRSLFGAERELQISIQPSSAANNSVEESKEEYLARLQGAAKDVEKGKVVHFTAKEFQALAAKLQG